MTTTIKVTSHNYPALVTVTDEWKSPPDGVSRLTVEERILRPEDGEVTFYCTTTRTVQVTDLDYDHPDVLALAAKADAAA